MSGRRTIAFLTVTQLVLLGAVVWLARELQQRRVAMTVAPVTHGAMEANPHSNSISSQGPVSNSGPAFAEKSNIAVTNHPSAEPERRTWRRVESEDYRTYVKNLRAIGCPEQTLRDIVSADVVQAFGAKRAEALNQRYHNFQYWRADPAESESRIELDRQREAIDDEMRWTLKELLGPDFAPAPASYAWRAADLDQRLAFLPDDKRQHTRDVLLQYSEVDQQVKALAGNDVVSESTDARMKILDQYDEKRSALKAMLTPDQFQQVELTTSWTAENLRHALVHFQPTREEFITLFNLWQPYDEALARLHAEGGNDPGNLQEPLYANIRKVLPANRYQQYVDTWWK